MKPNLAIEMYSRAIEQDSDFSWAYAARAAKLCKHLFHKG